MSVAEVRLLGMLAAAFIVLEKLLYCELPISGMWKAWTRDWFTHAAVRRSRVQ